MNNANFDKNQLWDIIPKEILYASNFIIYINVS